MRTLFLCFLVSGFFHTRTLAQIITIHPVPPGTNFSINAGKKFEAINFLGVITTTLSVNPPGLPTQVRLKASPDQNSDANQKNLIIAGPADITITVPSGNPFPMFTYRISENSTNEPPTSPSTAVVIPSDASGPVEIVLESSSDLVTWIAATPGTYGSSTVKRFFRVRAIQR